MPSGILKRIHAAPTGEISIGAPLERLPGDLGNAPSMVKTLQRLGLMVPSALSIAASSGQPMRASGHKYGVIEVDAALSRTNLSITDRLRLKSVMDRVGILKF